jgi:2-polyprenyl-3-methyl-5-hydroxy-6-metoxy-1,4-benzoquinol methylase
MAETKTIQGGYDRWATVYDHEANPLQALEEPLMREAIGTVHGLNVLDLGCGTGRHSLWLAANGATVTAVDFSEGMLAEARRKSGAEKIRYVVHDLHERLPFNTEFDLVVSGLMLEHLHELGGFFGEVQRVLKPNGRAILSTMHPAMFLRGTQARFTDPTTGELIQPGSYPHSISAFVMEALRAGFQIENVAEYSPDVFFAAQHSRATKYIDWPMLVMLSLRAAR